MKLTTVFFDLETGGVKDSDPDIQLAAVAVLDWKEVGTFEKKITFDAHQASPEALAMNSYDPGVWAQKAMSEEWVVEEFSGFLSKFASLTKISKAGNPYLVARLAGHNAASFDAPRLHRMFKRNGGRFCPADIYRPLDTLQLALWYFLGRENEPESYQLGTLATTLGIETPDAHDALGDVRTTIAIAKRILTSHEEDIGRPPAYRRDT